MILVVPEMGDNFVNKLMAAKIVPISPVGGAHKNAQSRAEKPMAKFSCTI